MNEKIINKFYPESKFGGFTDIDGTIVFYNRVNALLKEDDIVVDFGCGRGNFLEDDNEYRKNLRNLRGKVRQVIGIDVDQVGETNNSIDIFKKINAGGKWPIEDGSIDLLVSDQVLEHINNPDYFFIESRRVLKPGGFLCIRTTNKWGYVAIGARIFPKDFHHKIIHHLQDQRQAGDIFPTLFKCNTIPDIKKMLAKYKFEGVVYGYSSEPGYLFNNSVGSFIIYSYHLFCPQYFKTTLFVFSEKIQ